MSEIRVILISSVRPEPTTGGEIVLYRHLVNQPGMTLEVFGQEPKTLTTTSAIRRIFGYLGQTRFHRLTQDFYALWGGRWLDSALPRQVVQDGRTIVLTVAHGDACMAALRFAKKHHLPLVTFFQDWWMDIPDVHRVFRTRLKDHFLQLFRASSVALCVSNGMRSALGVHSNAHVLYPIPAKARLMDKITSAREEPYHLFYFGNLSEYGPMLGEALKAFVGHKSLRLEVRGTNPAWTPDFCEMMRAEGRWKDFAPRNELDKWLAEADAFLIAMVFDPKLRRRMETSFPSKLAESAQYGRPLVVWGPEYCSAIKWGQTDKRALCVTDPNPSALCRALENLAGSPVEQQRLAAAAQRAAHMDFNPEIIQGQFQEALHRALKPVEG